MVRGASSKDWAIGVSLDTSSAEGKVKRLEQRFNRLGSRVYGSRRGGDRINPSSEARRLREVNALNAKREVLYSRINKLSKMDVVSSSELGRMRARVSTTEDINKLQAFNIELIKRARQETERLGRSQATVSRSTRRARDTFRPLYGASLSDRRASELARLDPIRSRVQNSLSSLSDIKNPTAEVARLRAEAAAALPRIERLHNIMSRTNTAAGFRRAAMELKQIGMATAPVIARTKALTAEMYKQNFAANSLGHSIKNLARSYISIFAIGAGLYGFYRIGRDMESLQAQMLAATGNAKAAGEEFDFIRRVSMHYGVNLKEAASGYVKLGAAARAANFDQEQTRNIFLGASEASRAFGLNAQRTNLVYLAFSQMLSKGVVSMEELRRQLGEQIPGAFQIAAKAMEVSTKELDKMVSSGQLASDEFIPKFVAELRNSVRESGALEAALKKVQAAQERTFSQLVLNIQEGFDEGQGGFASGFENLTLTLKQLAPAFRVFGRLLGGIFNMLAGTLSFLSPIVMIFTSSLESLFQAFDRAGDVNIAIKDLNGFETALRYIIGAIKQLQIYLLGLQIGLIKIARWLGISDEKSGNMAKQLLGLIPAALGLLVVFRALGGVFKLFNGFLRLFGINLTSTATKTGLLSRAFSSLSKNAKMAAVAGAMSHPNAFHFLAGTGRFIKGVGRFGGPGLAALGAGFEFGDALTNPNASRNDAIKQGVGFAGGVGGAIGGAKLGAMIGALGGPIGIAIGGLIGAGLGAWGGEAASEWIAGKFLDNKGTAISPTMNYNFNISGDFIGEKELVNRAMDEAMYRTKRDIQNSSRISYASDY